MQRCGLWQLFINMVILTTQGREGEKRKEMGRWEREDNRKTGRERERKREKEVTHTHFSSDKVYSMSVSQLIFTLLCVWYIDSVCRVCVPGVCVCERERYSVCKCTVCFAFENVSKPARSFNLNCKIRQPFRAAGSLGLRTLVVVIENRKVASSNPQTEKSIKQGT